MTERNNTVTQRSGATMKRRGILAAAGAVVAGLVAKQTSQPISAANPPLLLNQDNPSTAETSITATANTYGLQVSNNSNTSGAIGISASGGTAISAHGGHYGVYGTVGPVVENGQPSFAVGVRGEAINVTFPGGIPSMGIGVQAIGIDIGLDANATGIGVSAIGSQYGVFAQCDHPSGQAVRAASAEGFPIVGAITGGSNNPGVVGAGGQGPGVQGYSISGHGLVGTTTATDGQHAALIGYVQSGGNAVGLRGSVATGATGLAGVFDGDVSINGALRVYGFPKNAAVKHPEDNTYRLLYCEESPESWFADYGEGTLAGGKAEISLDPDFAALVDTSKMYVFPVAHEANGNGLAVTARHVGGFTVQEHAGGTSGGTFSYRVVAKRKDIVGERLAKVAPPPPLTPVAPIKIPEAPEVKPPTKKP